MSCESFVDYWDYDPHETYDIDNFDDGPYETYDIDNFDDGPYETNDIDNFDDGPYETYDIDHFDDGPYETYDIDNFDDGPDDASAIGFYDLHSTIKKYKNKKVNDKNTAKLKTKKKYLNLNFDDHPSGSKSKIENHELDGAKTFAALLANEKIKLPDPEKIERNDDIIICILNAFMGNIDEEFEEVIKNEKVFQKKELSSSDLTYVFMKNKFDAGMQSGIRSICRSYRVKQIEKIICPYLWAQFEIKKKKKLIVDGVVYVEELYHGTAKANIKSICKDNFDWRKCGTHVGTKFGKGISFAKYATYATFYPKLFETPRTMLVTNVSYVAKQVGNSVMQLPTEGYDTTTNAKGEVIVKYEDADFCPLYVIYYS